MKIPKNHPKYEMLKIREQVVKFYKSGIVVPQGLIAHGRGEMFDYLIGEQTLPIVERAIEAAVVKLLLAKNPVISVNGNTCALVGKKLVQFSKLINANLEVNLFYRTNKRLKKIQRMLRNYGVEKVLGSSNLCKIQYLESKRSLCAKEGIYTSDVVLVALEDGDRTEALKKMHKTVIAIDLNPLSRTSRFADITIVDNIVRAIALFIKYAKILKKKPKNELEKLVSKFDNSENLSCVMKYMAKRICDVIQT